MLAVNEAKHQVSTVAKVERRAIAISVVHTGGIGSVIRAENCGPKHLVAPSIRIAE